MDTRYALTIPQGSLVWPKEPFTANVDRRTIKAFPGQSFWVTNTQLNQEQQGVIMIARSGKNAGHAYPFSADDAAKFFKW